MSRLSALVLLGLAACAPDLGELPPRSDSAQASDWPALLTGDMIAAVQARDPTRTDEALAGVQSLDARAAGLRARAADLGQPVMDANTRARLLAATGG